MSSGTPGDVLDADALNDIVKRTLAEVGKQTGSKHEDQSSDASPAADKDAVTANGGPAPGPALADTNAAAKLTEEELAAAKKAVEDAQKAVEDAQKAVEDAHQADKAAAQIALDEANAKLAELKAKIGGRRRSTRRRHKKSGKKSRRQSKKGGKKHRKRTSKKGKKRSQRKH
jgi:hypothetical protein